MAFYQAPKGHGGVSVGGQYFPIVNGCIETPDDGDYSILVSLGFVRASRPAATLVEAGGKAKDKRKGKNANAGKPAVANAAKAEGI